MDVSTSAMPGACGGGVRVRRITCVGIDQDYINMGLASDDILSIII